MTEAQATTLPIKTTLSKRVLLIYPIFPPSFWSFDNVLKLVGKKALLPPLNLITVAAILPQSWEFKLVDHNVREITELEWAWADLVIISGMLVQKPDLLEQVKVAKRKRKSVVVGGPYATSLPEEVKAAGADYLVLDEGEITLPMFVKALETGETHGRFRASEKPDVTHTPVPRYDLLDLSVYDTMSLQFSRGCPFQCEFCDIIVLYGRKSRTKEPAQILAELDVLYTLGWRGPIFMVDDNFIGNKRNVKRLLPELKTWQAERGKPFGFITEASVNLADDEELMDLMAECGFFWIFVGIETPDESSLVLTKKFQNTRTPLVEAIDKIHAKGIRVIAGLIIGFDGEKAGAGDRIVQFAEQAAIPTTTFSMLQALPGTALWHRLQKEGRLISGKADINQSTLMNFVPDRPIEEIVHEYIAAIDQLYDPERYLKRVHDQFIRLGLLPHHLNPPDKTKRVKPSVSFRPSNWIKLRVFLTLAWRQGIKRSSRCVFWRYFFSIHKHNPRRLSSFLSTCAYLEHFLDYYPKVKADLTTQLTEHLKVSAGDAYPSEPLATTAMDDAKVKAKSVKI